MISSQNIIAIMEEISGVTATLIAMIMIIIIIVIILIRLEVGQHLEIQKIRTFSDITQSMQ